MTRFRTMAILLLALGACSDQAAVDAQVAPAPDSPDAILGAPEPPPEKEVP